MSTQTLSAPISSLSPLFVQTQAARWKVASPEQLTGAHLYLDIARSGNLFHGYSGGMNDHWKCYEFDYSRLGLQWVAPYQDRLQPNPARPRHLPSDSRSLTCLGLQRLLPVGSVAQRRRRVLLTSPRYSFCSIESNQLIAYVRFHPWCLIRPAEGWTTQLPYIHLFPFISSLFPSACLSVTLSFTSSNDPCILVIVLSVFVFVKQGVLCMGLKLCKTFRWPTTKYFQPLHATIHVYPSWVPRLSRHYSRCLNNKAQTATIVAW